jgi:hypothetical protein
MVVPMVACVGGGMDCALVAPLFMDPCVTWWTHLNKNTCARLIVIVLMELVTQPQESVLVTIHPAMELSVSISLIAL